MLWRAQSTVPIPEDAVPKDSRLGLSTASWDTQVLRYSSLSGVTVPSTEGLTSCFWSQCLSRCAMYALTSP